MISSSPIQPKKIVVTGPRAQYKATRLAPILLRASEVMKTGRTVLTSAIARARPYISRGRSSADRGRSSRNCRMQKALATLIA
jgi:hypothetical protein